ncbi:MAG: hypothetical protein NWF05_05475 [Candidatus Bathyarchaeota archaeon]|nr:hypothetical protein [Candidatus Bathyarchaeota archaeon]
MENTSVRFKVSRYSYAEKAATTPTYKVHFENKNGHSLVLVSSSKDIYSGFPLGETVDVKVNKAQQTLAEAAEET